MLGVRFKINMMGKSCGIKLVSSWESQELVSMAAPVKDYRQETS
jgi:hypothetical protein